MNKSSFVFYETFHQAIEMYESPEVRADAYCAIVHYGLYGEEYKGNSDTVLAIFRCMKPFIDDAKANRDRQRAARRKGDASNGKRFDHDEIRKRSSEGFTVTQIIEEFGCSESTVKRALHQGKS